MNAGTAILIFLSLLLIAENQGEIRSNVKRQTRRIHFPCVNHEGEGVELRYLRRFMKALNKKMDNVLEKLSGSLSGKEPRNCTQEVRGDGNEEILSNFKRKTRSIYFPCVNHEREGVELRYLRRFMKALDKKMDNAMEKLSALSGKEPRNCTQGDVRGVGKEPRNCAEVLKSGYTTSGVYTINPDGRGSFKVYCDQKTNGGGWTVFQRRQYGLVDFYRCWADYKNGFGDLEGEFWLGLDKINRLTHQTRNRLRVDLQDHQENNAYAEYDFFAVADERDKFRLSLGNYTGTAGDSLSYHREMAFTTKDRDNDANDGNSYEENCAQKNEGAWWFNNCQYSHLNGVYYQKASVQFAKGINWFHWKGDFYSLEKAQMKFRPTVSKNIFS